jgi:hypothetical protein
MALARITYDAGGPWSGSRFDEIHERLEKLVVDGPPPAGPAMYDRYETVDADPPPPLEDGGGLHQVRQRPLDLLLLGSLHPAMAQILGLYWYDGTAVSGTPYDYLLIADHGGSLGGKASSALEWINSTFDFTVDDGVVIFNKVAAPAVPLARPTGGRTYALPGATMAFEGGGPVLDGTNNAGLTWDRRQVDGVLATDAPVLYHVWNAFLDNRVVPASESGRQFRLRTENSPVPVSRSILSPPYLPPTPSGWPPFPLHYIDCALPDGWYAYRLSSIDIFGRHSRRGASAAWYQWSPPPNPKPWYYVDPPAERLLHASAIRLLDKLPPPPPAGVEAFALDPEDPMCCVMRRGMRGA